MKLLASNIHLVKSVDLPLCRILKPNDKLAQSVDKGTKYTILNSTKTYRYG